MVHLKHKRPMRRNGKCAVHTKDMTTEYGWCIYTLVFAIAGIVRWATALGSYSGYNTPPQYGDYEAQRHWQEITVSLPLADWYRNTSDNDLSYWGLDYPPLTAYHSWLMGIFARNVNDSYVALHSSRGIETPQHKTFMRATVLLADALTLMPTLMAFALMRQSTKSMSMMQKVSLLILHLFYPGLILIDHGHFQYNCVSLGLYTAAVLAIMSNRMLLACIAFVMALNYKQMELYHALPIFCFMLAHCIKQRSYWKSYTLAVIAVTTLATFAIIWLPFLYPNPQNALDVLRRIFPVARGIYEDKVANFWCISSVAFKWRNLLSRHELLTACTGLVALTSLISCLNVLWCGDKRQFLCSNVVVALSFFLFSYHVHEKSILLVAIPCLLAINLSPVACVWLLHISMISLHHLAVKDGTRIAFYALELMYAVMTFEILPTGGTKASPNRKLAAAFWSSIIGGLVICIAGDLLTPPVKYPHIFPLLNATYCFVHFGLFFLYFYYLQFTCTEESKTKVKSE